jgi:uncharacterized RDD family membrane protein YckC
VELRRLFDSGALSRSTRVFQTGREHESVALSKVIAGVVAPAASSTQDDNHFVTPIPDVTLETNASEPVAEEPVQDSDETASEPYSVPPSSTVSTAAKLPPFWRTFWSLHPKRRYCARMVDLGIGTLLVNQVLTSLVGYQHIQLAKITWVLLLGVFVTGLINALTVSRFGTTFGKWMFSIRVQNEHRGQLSLPHALQREGLVFLFGFSGGVVFTLFLSLIISGMFIYLKRNTPWDYLTRTSTEIESISFLRIFFGVVLVIVINSTGKLL